MDWAESDTDSESECSSNSDSSSDKIQTRKRRKRQRPLKPPEPPRNNATDMSFRVQRRHNYEHARRRIKDKKSDLSDINTAFYLFLRKLNETESDFFAEVRKYLTKGSNYFTNGS